jgi:hypothetical protein
MGKQYTYFVEDGELSFQVTSNTLYGKIGDVIQLGADGFDEDCKVYILAIEDENVFCVGSVEFSLPTSEAEAEWWRNHLGIGRIGDYAEFEVFYRRDDEDWESDQEMSEVICADSADDVRKIFDESHTNCVIKRVVELS